MQFQRITYKKIVLITALFVLMGCFIVYFLTQNRLNNKFKNEQSKGGSVSISTTDLKDDFISLQQGTGSPQTGNINISGDVSADKIQGSSLTSNAQDGTSPLNVYSSTLVNNLNSDMVDGKHSEELTKTQQMINNITNTTAGETIAQGTTSQYYRGDKTWQTLNKSVVGLQNVENTALSTWTGSTNITALGTVAQGTWNAGAITSSGAIQGASLSVGAGTITSGTINGQTISSSANFTGTITVASTVSTPNVRVALYPNDNTNPDIINAGGYQAAASGSANFGGGATEKTVLYNNRQTRIRQDGYITQFKMYFASKPASLSAFYFQVWRKSGSVWNQVYSENELSKITGGSINTVTLTSPALVQEGDYAAVRWTAGSDPGDFIANTFSSVASSTYTVSGSVPGTTGYDFTTGTLSATYAPINVYMQAPMFVTIGDSIIGGRMDHGSYIDNPAINYDMRESTIAFQLGKSLGWNFQNMGIGGNMIAQIDARFDSDVVALKPKFAVIEGGVVDLNFDTSVNDFTNSWRSILDKSVNANITPIIIRILPCASTSLCSTAKWTTRYDEYNNALTTLLASYPSAIVVDGSSTLGQYRVGGDAGNLWDSRPGLTSDGLHYNYAGKNMIAKLVEAALPTKLAVKGQLETGDVLVNGRIELFGGGGTRYIEPQRSPLYEQTGAGLVVKAGTPTGSSLSIDKNGGDLYLSGGGSEGTGSSNIYIQTATAGSSGSSENAPTTKMTILGNGNVGIGTTTPANQLTVNAPVTADSLATTIVTPTVATNKGLVVQGYTSQSADLIQAQSSAGALLFQVTSAGNLVAKSAAFTGTLTVNGHIITGNTSGSTTIAAGAQAGAGASTSITGNDTAGSLAITTGTGATNGTLGTVTFANAYGAAPYVVLTPSNADTTNLKYYVTSNTTTFTISLNGGVADSTQYNFYYHVLQ